MSVSVNYFAKDSHWSVSSKPVHQPAEDELLQPWREEIVPPEESNQSEKITVERSK